MRGWVCKIGCTSVFVRLPATEYCFLRVHKRGEQRLLWPSEGKASLPEPTPLHLHFRVRVHLAGQVASSLGGKRGPGKSALGLGGGEFKSYYYIRSTTAITDYC